ncbi:hypothetical protein ACWDYH_28950 [Nocardia goodfellowii]|uniref:Uncharacterized protein HemX n=1 Tax=Nocardia goodfellowii TaxID=882446 RepID=A0ABS4Q915_9NOCA|nr:hypothetical protein [Nocardia goodfellowii]MBP2188174.1 uncharacterized protein HemX [Nocardia goodfellowii]
MYLDLLTNATLLDHAVWANPDTLLASDTYTQAMELAAKKKKKGGGGLIFGLICLLVVVAIAVGGYLLYKRSKKN